MGLFSALMGNEGAVDQNTLIKQFDQLLIDGEDIEILEDVNE